MDLIYDNISGYEFGFNKDGDMIVVKDGKEVKLCDNQNILNNMIEEIN
tara:strand:+ start:1834 stop:1977 length:144 start_codon:yes stop_codon:yes gene_type:complete